jgi:hypothetical protein
MEIKVKGETVMKLLNGKGGTASPVALTPQSGTPPDQKAQRQALSFGLL